MSDPMAHAHSNESNEHYTPLAITEPARVVLEHFDLDPASCAVANEVVKATRIFKQGDSAFAESWDGRVFLNPPGGKLHRKTLEPITAGPGYSSAAVWWAKLVHEWESGNVHSAIFVCFSLAVFRTSQDKEFGVQAPFEYPFCVPRERVRFDVIGADGKRVPGKQPPQDSAIVLLPPKDEYLSGTGWPQGPTVTRFIEQFSPLGRVRQ